MGGGAPRACAGTGGTMGGGGLGVWGYWGFMWDLVWGVMEGAG